VVAQKAPDNVLPQVTGDLLSAFVPKADPAVTIHEVDTGLQPFEDGLIDFRIVQFRHTMTPKGIIGRTGNKFN
jgi:hypothetical protein